jgi:arsenite methyltransferase
MEPREIDATIEKPSCCGSTAAPIGDDPGGIEAEVRRRYAEGAREVAPGLCCPISYDADLLRLLPREIIEKDYGCGDPSKYVGPGDRVLDLGSGAGKICYMLAQKVGAEGNVIGVDFNDAMLALSRKHQDDMAGKLGYANVQFVKGRIQDLALNLDLAQDYLENHPVRTVEDVEALEAECERLRTERPMIPDSSVDVVVSNCVLNLVRPQDKEKLFAEIHRVLDRGGRAVISDIVCDENPTPEMIADPDLWTGCISGAFREDEFLRAFENAGFYGIEILERQDEPWHVIDGIEFRSITVRAFKGKEGLCLERKQAAVYKGPWKSVTDDDGHTLYRGQRMAVCDKTFSIYTDPAGPYVGEIVPIKPREEIPLENAAPFKCNGSNIRQPQETKGKDYRETSPGGELCCGPDCC